MTGEDASDERRAEVREVLGLNDPVYVQFSKFIVNVIQGDFGISYQLKREVSDLIAEKIEYITGSSTIHQSASDIVKSKKGVCQDFAHIFISCLRFLGFSVRYVSGYLKIEGVNQQDATHAWACLLYTSPSPRDRTRSRMPSSA